MATAEARVIAETPALPAAAAAPETPIRLAMVVPSLRGGGLERIVADLALELDPARFRVAVFCVSGLGVFADELRAAGIEVHDCTEAGWRMRGVPIRLLRAIARFRADIIHAHSGTWYPAAVVRWLLRRPRLVFTDHGRYLPEPAGRARVERWCARRSDAVITVSDELADYVTRSLSLGTRPRVVPNGIDLRRFRSTTPSSRADLRREWQAHDDDVVGIAIGRFVPVKNHAGMLEAFARARAAAPRLRLVLLGSGALEGSLRERANALGIADRVHFAGFRRDIPACLQAADVFVLPSDSEGLPMSLLEALAAGLPVVATRVGGIAEALGKPACGLLVPPRDVEALAGALAVVGSDRGLRLRLGALAGRRAADFSLEACARRYADVYRELPTADRVSVARRGG